MRPRHYAADNLAVGGQIASRRLASMRPRHYAADNRSFPRTRMARIVGFNEAAALRRG